MQDQDLKSSNSHAGTHLSRKRTSAAVYSRFHHREQVGHVYELRGLTF